MLIANIRTSLQRLASTSPIVLGVVSTFSALVVTGIDALVPDNAAGSTFVTILFVIVLCLLFATVTWFRDDDWLAAGVLMTLIVYAALAAQTFVLVLFKGGIGPAAIWSAVTVSGAIIYAILLAPVVGGLVALARKLTRNRGAPLPNTR